MGRKQTSLTCKETEVFHFGPIEGLWVMGCFFLIQKAQPYCSSSQNLPFEERRESKRTPNWEETTKCRSFVGLMFLGIVVYLRLWTIDYRVSSYETNLIRRQFDLANREAMDESAEWRLKYDVEAERSTKCMSELKQMKGSLEEDGNAANVNLKLATLQKENIALGEQIEALKQELEAEKLKCSMQ